ncbi:hypothetical protein [Frankia sp. Cj3]|uniref:hypothetical protein n=1 Tax=Frankia sp. Cj3 TaxID=2880976 RepID=UPI001EF49C9E|nr:hypothetical protein [Frankia sp. Cj3]
MLVRSQLNRDTSRPNTAIAAAAIEPTTASACSASASSARPQRSSLSASGSIPNLRLFEHLPIRVMNPPLREATGFTKLLHSVTLAAVGGWSAPKTRLSSIPDEARVFIADCPGGVIFKGTSAAKTWAQQYEASHDPLLDRLGRAPVLFQERIVGPDVRVHRSTTAPSWVGTTTIRSCCPNPWSAAAPV